MKESKMTKQLRKLEELGGAVDSSYTDAATALIEAEEFFQELGIAIEDHAWMDPNTGYTIEGLQEMVDALENAITGAMGNLRACGRQCRRLRKVMKRL